MDNEFQAYDPDVCTSFCGKIICLLGKCTKRFHFDKETPQISKLKTFFKNFTFENQNVAAKSADFHPNIMSMINCVLLCKRLPTHGLATVRLAVVFWCMKTCCLVFLDELVHACCLSCSFIIRLSAFTATMVSLYFSWQQCTKRLRYIDKDFPMPSKVVITIK